jgi:hypothetical protein
MLSSCCKSDFLFGIWWSNFSFMITCYLSIYNSLPAQIRSATYSKPPAMTPLLNETLHCPLTCYVAFHGQRVLFAQDVYFKIWKLTLSTLQNVERSGTVVRVKPWPGDRSYRQVSSAPPNNTGPLELQYICFPSRQSQIVVLFHVTQLKTFH